MLSIVNTLSKSVWLGFLEVQAQANIYHTPEMFTTFTRAENHTPMIWAALEAGEVMALLIPVIVTVLHGPLRSLTTRAVAYGGALCASGAGGQRGLSALLAAYERQVESTVLFTELRSISSRDESPPTLAEHGYHYRSYINFVLNLRQPEELLWSRLSKSCRQSIRTARNKGLAIEALTDAAQLADVYDLLQKVYTRVQVPLAGSSLFQAALEVMGPSGFFKGFVARVGGVAIGACLLLAHKDRVIYWYGGLDRAWSAYSPMEALLWQAVVWSRSRGYTVFDFGGAGQPTEHYGPRRFKAKFGGELVEADRFVRVHAPLRLKASEFGYRMLRRFL